MKTQDSAFPTKSRLAMRMGLCAAALVGTAATMSSASAAIVTFNTPIVAPNTFDGIYVNFLTGATGTLNTLAPGWDFNPYQSGIGLSFFWSQAPGQSDGVASTTTGPYVDLAPGTTISAASTFARATATGNTLAFQAVGTHTLGFRFYNETTAAINYGYATLTAGGASGYPLTITGWSFENTGAAITTPVPEPTTGAMLAMGALALGALKLRRNRRQQAA